MKKYLSLILALVMALSLTTVAWGAAEPVADTAALQAAIDNATAGTTIQLAPGVTYETVYLRHTDSNVTGVTCHPEYCGYTTDSVDDFRVHWEENSMNSGHYPHYKATIENVTIVGADGATIAGVQAHSSQTFANVRADAVLGNANTGGYYTALNISNLTFKDVAFTGQVNIESSLEDAVYDGVTFDGCTFTTGGTASGNGAAIRYYNESNNGNVKNITVNNCSFNTCYQGVYAPKVYGVTVTNCSFDTTGHNAISNQVYGAVKVEIIGNTFMNIGDRVIRFREVGADSNITINNNIMVNSGDENGQLIRPESVDSSAAVDLEANYWDGKDLSTAVANFAAPTTVGITGGTWDTDVSAYVADGVAAAKVNDDYIVGADAIAAAATAVGTKVTVLKGSVTLNNGTTLDSTSGEYTVPTPAPAPVYPYYPPVVDNTTDTKVDSAQTFDAGVALYVGMSVMGAVVAVSLSKKRED